MQKWPVLIGLLLATLLSSGCQVESQHSGFLDDEHGATPIQLGYDGSRPTIQISDPKNTTVIVYTHGQRRPQQRGDCSSWVNQVPPSLKAIQSDQILIYYHCSTTVDRPLLPYMAGNWIYRRADELAVVIDELQKAGVSAEDIFLAGHSAGGWISLMAAREFGEKFNSVIAYAPAMAGRRSEKERYPIWRQEIRPRQIEDMLQADHIRALLFAYEDDPFERPQDLVFLTDAYPESLELIGYRCGSGHVTHIRDCQQEQTTQAILRFIGDQAE
jgi:pimeloyl-ACP methyl ester carboxylesterase